MADTNKALDKNLDPDLKSAIQRHLEINAKRRKGSSGNIGTPELEPAVEKKKEEVAQVLRIVQNPVEAEVHKPIETQAPIAPAAPQKPVEQKTIESQKKPAPPAQNNIKKPAFALVPWKSPPKTYPVDVYEPIMSPNAIKKAMPQVKKELALSLPQLQGKSEAEIETVSDVIATILWQDQKGGWALVINPDEQDFWYDHLRFTKKEDFKVQNNIIIEHLKKGEIVRLKVAFKQTANGVEYYYFHIVSARGRVDDGLTPCLVTVQSVNGGKIWRKVFYLQYPLAQIFPLVLYKVEPDPRHDKWVRIVPLKFRIEELCTNMKQKKSLERVLDTVRKWVAKIGFI